MKPEKQIHDLMITKIINHETLENSRRLLSEAIIDKIWQSPLMYSPIVKLCTFINEKMRTYDGEES